MVGGNSIIGPRTSIEVAVDMPTSYWLNEFFVRVGRYYDWMQFTGLTDKNGKEIYEGDILREDNGYRYQMKWHDFHAQWWAESLGNYGHSARQIVPSDPRIEVIGNIYENPDLLK